MKKYIKYNPNNKNKWLELRNSLKGKNMPGLIRFGGSDIAKVLDMDEYMSATEFFYASCDWIDAEPEKKLPMYRGECLEDIIYKGYWRYINPDNPSNEELISNVYGEKKIYRTGQRFNKTILNSKYPYLYANPDYRMFKSNYNPTGIIEMKAPTWRAIEKFESQLSPSYMYQVFMYMMLDGSEYSEIIQLVDATNPSIHPLEPNKVIYDQITDASNKFANLVLKGKNIVYNTEIPILEREQMLAEIAPEPNGKDHLTDFYTEQHKKKQAAQTVDGTEEQLDKVLLYLELKYSKAKKLEFEYTKIEQEIRSWFVGDIGEISFGNYGSISWHKRINIPFRIYKNYNVD